MRKAILPSLFLAVALTASGGQRTDSQMRAIAAAKLGNTSAVKGMRQGKATSSALQCLRDAAAFSIYAPADADGFVVVAKNDQADPILGYSTARLDMDHMPDGLKWYLQAAERQLQANPSAFSRQAPRRAEATFTPVDNFVTTTWSQEYPFDRKTPNNCPAGCVATALAQCMNYCQWPASAAFTGNYYVKKKVGKKETVEDKSEDVNTTYTWPYQDSYKSFGRYGDNIDELLRDCGYATYMYYTAESSGSYTYLAGIALATIFNYPQESLKLLERSKVASQDEWAQVIYDELANRSPIMYGASDVDFGGHAFVLSGVDADGLVYVNWGWRGDADGFFNLADLNPAQGASEFHFNNSAEIVYGIRPTPLATDHIKSTITGYTGDPYTFRWATETDDEGVEHHTLFCDLPYGFINYGPTDFIGVFGLFADDLTDGTSWVIEPDLQDRDTIWAGYGYASSDASYKDFAFYYYIDTEKGLKPGHTYRMSFGTCDDREGRWHSIVCDGGELAYEITYTGDPATSTVSEAPTTVPVLTAVGSIKADGSNLIDKTKASLVTRVYDLQGRLVYTAPTSRFNLWDVPARGALIVNDGSEVKKVVKW